jgi:porphobilinogen deaminase
MLHGARPLRLATRGSAQARTQAQVVAASLMAANPELIVTVRGVGYKFNPDALGA